MPLPTSLYSPVYNPMAWNQLATLNTNNCYSYAMNMPVNPLTNVPWGNPLVGYRPQPGVLSGLTMALNGSNICECVCADLAMCGRNIFNRALNYYAPVSNFCYRVYLVARLEIHNVMNGLVMSRQTVMLDYHWYVQNSQANSNQQFWSHKPGLTPVINVAPPSANVIVDPTRININMYNTRLGFFDIQASGNVIFPDTANTPPSDSPDTEEISSLLPLTLDQLRQISKHVSYNDLVKELNEENKIQPKAYGSGYYILYYDWIDPNSNEYTIAFNFLDNTNGLQYIYLIDKNNDITFIL